MAAPWEKYGGAPASPPGGKPWEKYVRAQEPDVLDDVLKSAGSGLVTGAHSLVGMGGDVENLINQGMYEGATALRGLFGYGPAPLKPADPVLPTSAEAEEFTGWDKKKHVPQTTAGRVVGTVAEYAPGALSMGGGMVNAAVKGSGALAKQGGANLAKYAATPAVVGEGAAQGVEALGHKELAPAARSVGALTGAGAASLVRGKRPSMQGEIDDLKREAGAGFDLLRETGGAVIEPAAFQAAVKNIRADLHRAGFDEGIHKGAAAALARLERDAASGAAVNFADIHVLEQVIRQAGRSIEPKEQFMAGLMAEKFEKWADSLKPADIIAGDAREAADKLIKSKSLYYRAKKGEILENLLQKARDRVGANYTTAGLMTAVRQELKNLKHNRKADWRRFRRDERDAITEIIRGGTAENLVRGLSKFDIRSGLLGSLFGTVMGGSLVAGAPQLAIPAALLAGGGQIARKVTDKMAEGKLRDLQEAILTGTPTRRPMPSLSGLGVYYGQDQ